MKFRLIPAILIAITLSIVTSRIVYFGFNSSYDWPTFSSRWTFDYVFSRNVYKYRILSKYLLTALDNQLSLGIPEKDTQRWIIKHFKGGIPHLYYAFFYLNTIFLCLTSVVWVFFLKTKYLFKLSDPEKYLLLFFLPIVINLSQFAVCPYDISSYFLQLITLYLFLRLFETKYTFKISIVCILIALATVNRESSALTVSTLMLLLYLKVGISKRSVTSSLLIIMSFIIPYVLLRIYIAEPPGKLPVDPIVGNLWNSLNQTGIAFAGLFFLLSLTVAVSRTNRNMIILFHIFSLPYIIVCFKDGILWEVRLYIPLFLSSIILSKLDLLIPNLKISNHLVQYPSV